MGTCKWLKSSSFRIQEPKDHEGPMPVAAAGTRGQEEGEENVKRRTVERMKTRRLRSRMRSGKKRRRDHRMERSKRLKKPKRRKRKRRKMKRVMSWTGLYVMADNYCFPVLGSTLKTDESLNSLNAHLPHQLTT